MKVLHIHTLNKQGCVAQFINSLRVYIILRALRLNTMDYKQVISLICIIIYGESICSAMNTSHTILVWRDELHAPVYARM